MKNVSRRGIFLASVFIICTVAVVWRRFGASDTKNPEQQSVRDSLYQQKRVLQYNTKVYSRAIRLADNGDIVVRLATDAGGKGLQDKDVKYNSYSHAGIISREHDTVFVYYTPDGALHPGRPVLRETLWAYGHPAGNKSLALYRIAMDSGATKQLFAMMTQLYRKHIPSDATTMLAGGSRLYGTTFVAYSFEKALQDTSLFHRSVADGKSHVSIDDITGSSRVREIESWQY